MRHITTPVIGSLFAGAVVVASTPTHPTAPAVSGCGSSAAVRTRFLASRELFRQTADSTQLAEIGIAVRPDSVWLVSSAAVCDSLAAAHNGSLSGPDTIYRITAPNIARMGSVYFLQVFPTGHPDHESVFVYDTTYNRKPVIYETMN